MAHSNSFPTVITVSQQLNQAHFQQTATSQMQHHTAVVNSQILFPQCQQALSLQSSQNGSLTPSQQMNNNNTCGGGKQMQHNNQFQQQQQQQQQHHLTIPVQLGAGNHAFTTAGIPLDLSYFVQGGCLPNCLPIQLTSPGNLQQGFQAALNCVNNNSNNDPNQQQQQQQQVQVSQSDGGGNSFLQFNFAYQTQPQHNNNSMTTFHQATQPNTALTTTPQPQTPSVPPAVVTNTPASVKRRKKPVASSKQADKPIPVEKFHSVAVQTEFDMSLCRQQIVVVPPKNCTCGAVAQAIASGAFQAASFPPGPRKPDKSGKIKRVNNNNKVESIQLGDGMMIIQQDEPTQQQEQVVQSIIHQEQQSSLTDQCNGVSTQPNCDNRGRPFSYECIYCPKRFSLHSRLVAHLRCHTGMRPFSCLQCGYSFTQRSYLNRHAAVHKQERPFSCLSCHKTYKHYGSLANHRKLHTKDTSDPSINEASAISESVLPPSCTISSATSQMFSVSSSSITSPQIFTSSAVAHPAIMSQMFPVSSTSITAPQMFHASSSSANPTGSSQQMFQVSSSASTPGVNQMFSNSQPMATFYQAHDASGFLLSLNSSAASSTGAAGTMLLLHPSNNNNNNNSITVPSSSTSAYVPIMSSSAFS